MWVFQVVSFCNVSQPQLYMHCVLPDTCHITRPSHAPRFLNTRWNVSTNGENMSVETSVFCRPQSVCPSVDTASLLQRFPCLWLCGFSNRLDTVLLLCFLYWQHCDRGGYTDELRVRTLTVANIPIKFTSSSGRRSSNDEFREPAAGAACPSHLAVFGTRYRIRYTGSVRAGGRAAGTRIGSNILRGWTYDGGRRGGGRRRTAV
jgi:hypothetical protein